MLKEFWAVTVSHSLYHVFIKGEESPTVEKIGMKGKSRVEVGAVLQDGNHVGLLNFKEMNWGLLMYVTREGQARRLPEEESTDRWGGNTSQLVGLFLKKDEADKCFKARSLKPLDRRWKKETLATLGKIGKKHPFFVPSVAWPITYAE